VCDSSDLVHLLRSDGGVGLRKLLPTRGLVVEGTLVLVGVAVDTAEGTSTAARKPRQPDLLFARETARSLGLLRPGLPLL